MGHLPAQPDALGAAPEGCRRRWRDLALFGAALALVFTLIPPLGSAAGRYVFAEAIRFSLLALAFPALAVLGAPLERLCRVQRRGAKALQQRASLRSRHRDRRAVFPPLAAYLCAIVAFRLPVVLNALVRYPALFGAEFVCFALVGPWLWGELVASPPFEPHARRGARAVLAALAMWTTWILAYLLGFAHGAYIPAFGMRQGGIAVLVDQQLATAILFLGAAAAFLPVIFSSVVGFLSEEEDPDAELARVARELWRAHPRTRRARH